MLEETNELEHFKQTVECFVNKYKVKDLSVDIEEKEYENLDANRPDDKTYKVVTIYMEY